MIKELMGCEDEHRVRGGYVDWKENEKGKKERHFAYYFIICVHPQRPKEKGPSAFLPPAPFLSISQETEEQR